MSTTGYNSHYIDSGWSNTNFYGIGNMTDISVGGQDIYYTTQQIGIYMINGAFQGTTDYYPIQTSTSNLEWIGVPNQVDDAYLVYPGYGFQLYSGTYYSANASKQYINNSSSPYLFYTNSPTWTSASSSYNITNIQNLNDANTFSANQTQSIKIYFRGTQIVTSGFT